MNMRVNLESLVLAAARGDTDAYGQLVDETSPLVCSITLAIVRDIELSRDVAQEVFLSAWRDLKRLRNPASFLPWLRQTARNRAKTALRTDMRRRRLGEPGTLDQVLPVAVDPRPNAADRMIEEEEAQALAEALASLPEETREVLTLYYREGQSAAQVAALLDLSEAAVKKRLSRARTSLRHQIGETLRRTAPGAAFTAAVMVALQAAAPPTAAAATAVLSASKVAGGPLGFAVLKLLAPLSGVLTGGLGGVVGVLIGARKLMRESMDQQERRALRLFAWVSSFLMILYAAALTLVMMRTHNPRWAILWFLMLLATVAVLQHVWLPRIVKRRMQAEMLRDPQWAAERRRKERRQAILGWTIGILGGSVGLAVGLWSALR